MDRKTLLLWKEVKGPVRPKIFSKLGCVQKAGIFWEFKPSPRYVHCFNYPFYGGFKTKELAIEFAESCTHTALECLSCGDVIFSVACHDFHRCGCGAIAIDGGFEYIKFSADKPGDFVVALVVLPKGKADLYDEWNSGGNPGIIKKEEKDDYILSRRIDSKANQKAKLSQARNLTQ